MTPYSIVNIIYTLHNQTRIIASIDSKLENGFLYIDFASGLQNKLFYAFIYVKLRVRGLIIPSGLEPPL